MQKSLANNRGTISYGICSCKWHIRSKIEDLNVRYINNVSRRDGTSTTRLQFSHLLLFLQLFLSDTLTESVEFGIGGEEQNDPGWQYPVARHQAVGGA